MRATTWIGGGILTLVLGLAGGTVWAGDESCGCGPCAPVARTSCNGWRTRSVRAPYRRSARYRVSYRSGARGSSWSLLRRYLRPTADPAWRRAYVRSFFLRRFPFAALEDAEAQGIEDLLDAAETSAAADAALPAAVRLRRGMARFLAADYVGARADFDQVLAVQPACEEARLGHLVGAIVRSDWKRAAGDLDALALAGALRPDDQLDVPGSFADADVLPAVLEGLRGYARYQFMDGDAHLVATWILAATGDPTGARGHARLARRWQGARPALLALERNLGLGAAVPKAAPATQDPQRAPRVQGMGPGPVVAEVGR